MLTLALGLAAGVLAQSAARHLHVPGIVLLLVAGAGLGPDGLGWVRPDSLGDGLLGIVDFAVAVILFEGGMNLEISRLRREQTAIRRLVTWGALLTLAGGALAAALLLWWPWPQAVLFGSLVVVTGPTVIGPLVRELRLRPRVATLLEAEGVLIDPVGAILAVLVLGAVLSPTAAGVSSGVLHLAGQLGLGTAAGLAGGAGLALLLRVRRLVPEGFENIFALSAVLVLFQACEEISPHSGILAVTLAGVVVGNVPSRVDRNLREFKDQLSLMLIGLLFILLAADVRMADVAALGWEGASVVAALVLVVRPLNVWIATAGSDLSLRERLFVGWIAPRGIVAAAVAALTARALGGTEGVELRALVFMTIAGTVTLAGVSALPVAALLRVRLPSRDRVAILGAQGLGLALARELHEAGTQVVFLDSNPQSCRRAEAAGFPVVFGNALQERTLERAHFESVRAAIGLTPNDSLNGLFVARAQELFGTPEAYVALHWLGGGETPEFLERSDARVLFEGLHDMERWDVRASHGELDVVRRIFREPEPRAEGEAAALEPREHFVILAVRRGDRVLPMSTGLAPRAGDVASVAVHPPEADEADRILRARGWHEAPAEAAAG